MRSALRLSLALAFLISFRAPLAVHEAAALDASDEMRWEERLAGPPLPARASARQPPSAQRHDASDEMHWDERLAGPPLVSASPARASTPLAAHEHPDEMPWEERIAGPPLATQTARRGRLSARIQEAADEMQWEERLAGPPLPSAGAVRPPVAPRAPEFTDEMRWEERLAGPPLLARTPARPQPNLTPEASDEMRWDEVIVAPFFPSQIVNRAPARSDYPDEMHWDERIAGPPMPPRLTGRLHAAPEFPDEMRWEERLAGPPLPQRVASSEPVRAEPEASDEMQWDEVIVAPMPRAFAIRHGTVPQFSDEMTWDERLAGPEIPPEPLIPALPEGAVQPGQSPEMPIFNDEVPLLQGQPEEPGEPPMLTTGENKPPDSARYRLQLAMNAMEPVLPPLALGLPENSLAAVAHVRVKKFVFTGNHVFNSAQLAKVVAPYTGRVITSEELEEARVELTKHYVEAGYITSGAVLPDQDVKDGIVRIEIVEGRLTEIDVRGNAWYRSWWLRYQMRKAAGRPFNFNKMKLGLQLLRQEPTISRINAEVKPGTKPGESLLEVSIKDHEPFHAGFILSNSRPPSVAEGLGELYFTEVNLTGNNDPLDLRWGLLRWTRDGHADFAGSDNLSAHYEVPLPPFDTTLVFHVARNDSSIIDETFAQLGITSLSNEYEFTVRQPLYQNLNNTVDLSLSADYKHNQTFLLGRPFTLEDGALNGDSTIFATRAALDWVNRSQQHVLALRTTFSLGFYAFGATRFDPRSTSAISGGDPALGLDPEIPDGKFFSWLFQGQYIDRILDTPALRKKPDTYFWNCARETLLVLRGNAQLSDSTLLSLEQFSLGGVQSVRGYRENQLLRDDGLFGSLEVRVPLWLTKEKTPIVSLAPFFDIGSGWDINKVDDQGKTIYSTGIGLLVNASKHFQFTIYWGHPFVQFHEKNVSLQDDGIHFSMAFAAF